MTAPWLRLDAAFFQSPKLVRAGWNAKIVMLALLTMCKQHDGDGYVTLDDVTAEVISHHLGVTLRVEDVDEGVARLQEVGVLSISEDDANHFYITNWNKYQGDPSNAERQARWRKRQKTKKPVTLRNVSNGDGTYGTGRDSPLTPPQDRGASSASPPPESGNGRALRHRERVTLGAILDELSKGGIPYQAQALLDRTAFREGSLSPAAGRAIIAKHEANWPRAISAALERNRRERDPLPPGRQS